MAIIGQDLAKKQQEFLQYLLLQKNYSQHTINSYRIDIRQFIDFLNKHHGKIISLDDFVKISNLDINSFASFRHKQKDCSRSLARKFASLRSFIYFLKKQHNIKVNPKLNIKSPKLPAKLPRSLNMRTAYRLINEQKAQQRDWLEARDQAVLLLMYGAGLRISEALQIKYSEIKSIINSNYYDNKKQSNLIYIKGKGNKMRTVPLLPIIIEGIVKYIELCPYGLAQDDVLFLGVKGKKLRPEIIQKKVRELRNLLQLPANLTPHCLRHSFASHLLNNGANIRSIQELLGHTNLSSTQIYTKLDQETILKSYNATHPRAKN